MAPGSDSAWYLGRERTPKCPPKCRPGSVRMPSPRYRNGALSAHEGDRSAAGRFQQPSPRTAPGLRHKRVTTGRRHPSVRGHAPSGRGRLNTLLRLFKPPGQDQKPELTDLVGGRRGVRRFHRGQRGGERHQDVGRQHTCCVCTKMRGRLGRRAPHAGPGGLGDEKQVRAS